MGIAESRERFELVRRDVERLETALAAAAHERDLRAEEARLASEGVAVLEQRLERLRRDGERALSEAEQRRESEVAEAEQRRESETAEAERSGRQAVAEAGRERDKAVAEAEGERDRSVAEVERRRQEEIVELERAVAEARARLGAREEELERARVGERKLREELDGVRERLGERERAAVGLERDLAEVEQRREREVAALERERDERARALAEADERLEESARRLAEADERLVARERELDAAAALVEAQGSELAAVRKDLRAKAEEADAAGEDVERARRDFERVSTDLAEARAGRQRVDAELGEARESLRRAEADLGRARVNEREAGRQLGEARERLAAREGHLKTAQAGVESRDRKLTAAERALADRDRRLALSEARLEKSQARAEHFKTSLVAIREGRAYGAMRVLWRLRHPFRRAPRATAKSEAVAEDDSDSSPAPVPDAAPAPARPRRQSPPRRAGGRLRVAAILDEMSAACFAPECDLVPLSLEGWREQLDREPPDLLLVESAWNGNDGEWQYRIAQYPRKDLAGLPALRELIAACRERAIPTAFWNKEDPVHFERFAEAASLFDHVFTTDARCVERYRELPGERTVAPLPFAAQPRIHNPVAVVPERSASPCFAGAWYRDRHPERRQALEALLDAARPRGLVIYDRRFGEGAEAFSFPERFAPHILGKLPYEQVLDVYKTHRVFLNANSVVDSPTMCSRRVLELAASDTAIVSTPGAALAALLGEGLVAEAGDEETAAEALERLLEDEPERRRRTRAARRAVFSRHTYADRLATIAATAGLDASSLRREPFAAPGAGGASIPAVAGDAPAGTPAADGGRGDHPWILQLKPGTTLPEPALADLAAAAIYAGADVIGADSGNGATPVEHRPVDSLDPRALLLRRELIEQRGRPTGPPDQVEATLRKWSDEGVRLYATDADLLSLGASQHVA